MPSYLEVARRALAGEPVPGPPKVRPRAPGYPVVPPEGCPRCGAWTFRLEESLWVCNGCAPEGAQIVQDEDLRWAIQSAAVDLLHETGVRIMENPAGPERFALGVWRCLGSPELREAFKVLRLDRLPLRYLEGADVPELYKTPEPEVLVRRKQRQGDLFSSGGTGREPRMCGKSEDGGV